MDETTITEPTVPDIETESTEEAQALPERRGVKGSRRDGFCWGTGRRKTSVARVRVRDGEGIFMVNGRKFSEFFPNQQDQLQILAPLRVTQTEGKMDVFVNVHGGGNTGQAGAVKMGLARALLHFGRQS